MELINIKTNKFQTPLTEELKEALPREVWEELIDSLTSIKFIQNLIAPEEVRGYAKDRPKEEDFYNDGRIKVDVTNPHILEDMDFFRERAIFFSKHGKYTHLIPNGNPKSEYAEFWREELRRWKDGLIRPSDGEWIPGSLYFYWNYVNIWLVEEVESQATNTRRKRRGERIRNFPKVWLGDYLFFHYFEQAMNEGRHIKVLKTRGCGVSFKMASVSPRNMYVYPGSGNSNYHLASDRGFLTGDKGIWGKILDNLDWIAEHTPLPKMRLVDKRQQVLELQLGYSDEYGVRKGLLSSVHGISLKDNPDKARGIRGKLIHYEEDGLFPHLEKAWGVNRKAVEDGDVNFGVMAALGTGGVMGSSFEGSEKLFYNPLSFNIHGLPNVYDRNSHGETICGFFWGAYLNRNNCFDTATGEPDIVKALVEILLDRYEVKYNSTDLNAITQKKAEEPITPQEAVMRTTGTIFPVADIKEYMEEIGPRKEAFFAEHHVGELVSTSNGDIIFKEDITKVPLRKYHLDGNMNKTGAVEIFEMPKRTAEGVIVRGRYLAGADTIDSDTGGSLFSMFVFDTFTKRIVAEYTGRPRLASEAYEISLRLVKFYNAELNYENNLKGLFTYYDNANALHYLCDTPQILRDMDLVKGPSTYGNAKKGTRANKEINSYGRLLYAEYLINPAYNQDNKLNLHTMRSWGALEETIYYNSDGNFDRISALGMLFILVADRVKRTQSLSSREDTPVSKLANDPFFTKHFKSKNAIDTDFENKNNSF